MRNVAIGIKLTPIDEYQSFNNIMDEIKAYIDGRFLVSRILCEYSRKERKSCTGIHTKPRKRGYNGRPDKHKGIYGSVQ